MSQSFGEIFASFLPLIILFVFFAYLYRATKRQYSDYKTHVDEVNTVNLQIVETNKEMIAELKAIKQILKDQS